MKLQEGTYSSFALGETFITVTAKLRPLWAPGTRPVMDISLPLQEGKFHRQVN
jgi:hypothetical protein